jgi:hypothetical protein
MPFDVSTADIESRWRVLDDDEADVGLQRLIDIERRLRQMRPALLAFYTALAPGAVKTDLLETVKAVLAGAVIRYLRNPDVNNRQDIGADGAIGIGFDTLTPGGVYLTEDDLAQIDDAVAAADGTPRPRVGSQVLVSTFPYRTSTGDPTILPTP